MPKPVSRLVNCSGFFLFGYNYIFIFSYDLLTKKTGDDKEILKYIQSDGTINMPQFFYLLQDRINQAEYAQKVASEELEELKKKCSSDQSVIKELKTTLQKLQDAPVNQSAAFPVLKNNNTSHTDRFRYHSFPKAPTIENAYNPIRVHGQRSLKVPTKKYMDETIILINN